MQQLAGLERHGSRLYISSHCTIDRTPSASTSTLSSSAIKIDCLLCDDLWMEATIACSSSVATELSGTIAILEQRENLRGQMIRILRLVQEAVSPIFQDLRNATNPCSNDWTTQRHRLNQSARGIFISRTDDGYHGLSAQRRKG
jgi:hypothetical protein